MLERILVAVDGSDPSRRAVELASLIAQRFEASLLVLHVIRNMQLPKGLREMAEAEKLDGRLNVLKRAGDWIIDEAKKAADSNGMTDIRTEIYTGDPGHRIIRFAEDNNVELIVMGTRGLGQVERAGDWIKACCSAAYPARSAILPRSTVLSSAELGASGTRGPPGPHALGGRGQQTGRLGQDWRSDGATMTSWRSVAHNGEGGTSWPQPAK